MKRSRFKACVYTQGKFGKHLRETLDTDNPYLYAHGVWPTKITANMLPEDYIEIRSRVIWYMKGYLKTSGITDMRYEWRKINHLFKDDYLFSFPIWQKPPFWGILGLILRPFASDDRMSARCFHTFSHIFRATA